MSIVDELERARHLADGDDEIAAKDLLLSLMPRIEQADRDHLQLEVFGQLGEIYLACGANDGVREYIRRIRGCLAVYSGICAGTMPEASPVRMSDAEIARMICRYSPRAQFLQTGLAAAQGDHERAETELTAWADSDEAFPDLADEHEHLLTYARILCATALCDDDLHMRSIALWQHVLDAIQDAKCSERLRVAGATAYGRLCVETGRLSEAEPWRRRAGARAQASGWELATARTQLERTAVACSAADHDYRATGVGGLPCSQAVGLNVTNTTSPGLNIDTSGSSSLRTSLPMKVSPDTATTSMKTWRSPPAAADSLSTARTVPTPTVRSSAGTSRGA